jgi:hypothetical protein
MEEEALAQTPQETQKDESSLQYVHNRPLAYFPSDMIFL